MLALFGKLPARRDFIARGVPNPVLEQIEPWLQEAMAQSKATLGTTWLDAYLGAPLWRFWWSASVAGSGAAGVLMPSVDKVGRYFPLLALDLAPHGRDFAAPRPDHERWFAAVEAALLSALSHEATLDALLDRLAAIPAGLAGSVEAPVDGSLWWTLGGEGHAPRREAFAGLPPPTAFAALLAGPAPAVPTVAADGPTKALPQ
ncbi:type VI secretion system-associated protein TagF [Acuticoccus sp. MNP-M23]|uniref:type VI secretion system-associated protein TagF n=1 Tax=Acuticoccus sp. MNP-M23 TaxID=3072793 RepID=UPI0028157F86|nr:type VI secretion system-associated protein TagF [Acuticoccus sp. MNP-M23]WMS44146.1 type VI secretion system-associated protein TagF [Acuticoccus sp. MNP-M23]